MTLARLFGLLINLSMALMVFGVALSAGNRRLRDMLVNPWLLARSLIAMFVVMPLAALVVARNFDFNHAAQVALVLLALSPVPPILPSKQISAGGGTSFVLGLLVVSALAAIVVVPAGIAVIGRLLGRELDVPFGAVGRVVGISVLLPVILGIVVARLAPAFAAKAARPISKCAGVLLLVAVLPVLWSIWGPMTAQMNHFSVLAIVVFIVVGILVGHLLGGPDPDDRTALALATATRHPGVALAVLHVLNPGDHSVMPVVLLALLASIVVSFPYVRWRTRAHAGTVREGS